MQKAQDQYHGLSWDISTEYQSLTSPEVAADLAKVHAGIEEINTLCKPFGAVLARAGELSLADATDLITSARKVAKVVEDVIKISGDLYTYASCTLSVDGSNTDAKELYGKSRVAMSKATEAYNPVVMFLKLCSKEIFEEYLKDPQVAPERFHLEQERLHRDITLSLAEENLIIGLTNNGPSAWGTLYDNLSGSISLDLELPSGPRKAGLAEASTLLQSADEQERKAAFEGIGRGWKTHEESAGAILNALAGWRHELYQRRSYKRPVHFLDDPLHKSRISAATLDAMMAAVSEAKPEARKAVKLKARALGKTQLAPWDLAAPCPQFSDASESRMTYSDAISLIAEGYGAIHPDMAKFVHMASDKKWIEGTVGPKKRPGGYCTWFSRSRTPRIYMTYAGGASAVMTLAHELGHAFHSWVMRELPFVQTDYPMTLAETASIFGETIVNNMVLSRVSSPQERLQICWTKARDVEAFLLNIPTRFAFEKRFYEMRRDKILPPAGLSALMRDTWADWYGDSLCDYDDMFWASKLHFSISSLSFYNFPYTFGYLFALGVYAQKDRLGDRFYDSYVNLLRDTGRMTAEEVAAKHLGADLTQPEFWRSSIRISLDGVRQLEDAINACGLK